MINLSKKSESNGQSIESTIQSILDGIRKYLAMDVAFVSRFTNDAREFLFVSADDDMSGVTVGSSDPLDESYCHYIAQGTLPEIIKDAASTPIVCDLSATRSLPVGGHLGVPLVFSNGTTFGSICCFSHEPAFDLNERNLNLVQIAAKLVAELMEQHLERQASDMQARARISRTIERGDFEVVYQPIVSLADRSLWGFEALARFPDADDVSPTRWFEEAFEAGLAIDLDLALINRAVAILPRLDEGIYLSINVNASTALSGKLTEELSGAELDKLVIELSEHDAVKDYGALNENLRKLKGNWRLAVDDVGAGYSSLRHILDVGPDIMKLDMTFVRNIDRRPSRAALVKAIVTFAKASGTLLIAEGIENYQEAEELQRLGVEFGQGYHFARPASKEQALSLQKRGL
ncbi:EAL domain-containing protein [Altererythrobacter sp. BO-6]|uniref:sensor domain-containing phosphodiesterase n=1 Tax=Altererythrobacter sp. BO-6 TaxID=2604537 RepID=UPI0013E16646|nr:EAL domain-containing protein [Altererythrobacter sp. BO-6]QIG53769.1 EAL domain-containing protein [Altererythrobacter sp. BO-6]